jgi:PAS domain-containing protein
VCAQLSRVTAHARSRRFESIGRQDEISEWDIVDADRRPIPSEELPYRRIIEPGEPVYGYEHGIKTGDSLRWLSINVSPLTASDGEGERVITAITEITHQNGNERQIDRVDRQ